MFNINSSDLALLLVEVLSKFKFDNQILFDQWIEKVAEVIEKIDSSVEERNLLIVRAIKWSTMENNNLKNPLMHMLIAKIMANEQNYEQARYHSLLSKNGKFCAKILIQLSAKAYIKEIDMIIVQVVMNLLLLKEKETAVSTFDYYTKFHPKINTMHPPYASPLLNFAYFLLTIIDDQHDKLQAFQTLCDLYKTALLVDSEYEKKLQKIGTDYFQAPVKKEQRSGGLFGDLFNQLFQELENDDSDSDTNESMQFSSSQQQLADLD